MRLDILLQDCISEGILLSFIDFVFHLCFLFSLVVLFVFHKKQFLVNFHQSGESKEMDLLTVAAEPFHRLSQCRCF